MDYRYEIDRGDGRWLLYDGDEVIYSTPNDEIAIAFDRESGTLHKHGTPVVVEAWLVQAKGKFTRAGFKDMADQLQLIRGRSCPLIGDPVPGQVYLHVDDVNRCISTSGYVLRLLQKLDTIDVPAKIIEA